MHTPVEEKRRHVRVPIESVTVEVYSPEGDLDHPEICSILNISEAGMLYDCSQRYAPPQALRLTFMLPDSIVIIRTDAVVVHAYRQGDSSCIGVRFVKLDSAERSAIKRFVQKVMHDTEARLSPRVSMKPPNN